MFTDTFDWILAAVLAVVSVVLFMGKGDFLLNAFSNNKAVQEQKKWSEEKRLKYYRVMGGFTACLAFAELLMALFAHKYPMSTFGILAFMIISMFVTFRYCKKNF